MIASCNFIDIGLFNSSNSFRMNEKITSADSNVDVRSPSFSAQISQVLMMTQGDELHQLPCFSRSNVPNS